MFWGRAASHEYDAWAELNSGAAGNWTWDWKTVSAYINKAEQLGTPSAENIKTFDIAIDRTAHGISGPIYLGWSDYIFPFVANWVPSWEALGLKNRDLAAGSTHGVTITPSTMDQTTQTRCDSKCGYIDPIGDSQRLVILTGYQVTKILFNGTDTDGNQVASGVSFSRWDGDAVHAVQARKEVILAGGTVGSPQILQLSGIGPASVLQQAGVDVLKDLPVGYNLQDHFSATMYFNAAKEIDTWGKFWGDANAQAAALTEWTNSKTGVLTYINEAVGYISSADIAGGAAGATTLASSVNVAQELADETARHNLPANVQKGLQAQYELQKKWLTDETGQLEVILQMWGNSPNSVGIQVALQHPFSRGTIFINSKNAFVPPTIDPGYLNSAIDQQIMRQGAEWVRRLTKSGPFANEIAAEAQPGADKTDAALLAYLQDIGGTEYHPMGTCSMLPEDLGGVVDTSLKVYGTRNVRVVDSAVIPIELSAHLMATTYGIAEYAADILKRNDWAPPPPPESSAAPTSTEEEASVGTSTDSAVAGAQQDAKSTGWSLGMKLGVGIGAGVGAGLILGLIAFCCCIRRNKKRPADEKGWYTAGNQDGAWDTQAAYKEQESFPMAAMAAPRPARPFSTTGSISTMATADLHPGGFGQGGRDGSSYSLGDYQRGGSPYRDYDDSPAPGGGQGYHTPQFSNGATPIFDSGVPQFSNGATPQPMYPSQQRFTPVQPR